MQSLDTIARALAAAFCAGPLEVELLVQRGIKSLGSKRYRWLKPLCERVCTRFPSARPSVRAMNRFLSNDDGLHRAWKRGSLRVSSYRFAPEMSPVAAAGDWCIRPLSTEQDLADWLGLGINDLHWFADRHHRCAKPGKTHLRHYHYRPLTKRFGQTRMIESPKPMLKAIQRRILAEILDAIPPHRAAHGFCKGRSIATFAAPHVGKCVVLKIDLKDFFPTITLARIKACFRTMGYPESVACLLSGLCTTTTPPDAWPDNPRCSRNLQQRLYAQPHLPQGAPTSPALANMCAYRLDCRLAGLAQAAGAEYTRYADDLAFSGQESLRRSARRFLTSAAATVMEEGFGINHRKTRVMPQSTSQRLCGLVVNKKLNVSRNEIDRLKAILTNCVLHGPESQNRAGHLYWQQHLAGRVAFVEQISPDRGCRLRVLLDRIVW